MGHPQMGHKEESMTARLRTQLSYALIAIVLSIILYFVLHFTTTWMGYVKWLIATNVVAFLLYGIDKTLAVTQSGLQQTRRTPNVALHVISLAGGFIGAFIGRLVFRHKSNFRQNPEFLLIILLSAALHIAFVYWYYFARNQPQ
jgi:uncharacterized membrane protein YsdA (DUF1294 family)